MNLVERLQSYMRRIAAERYEAVHIPPFTAFFHPFDELVHYNYAIPDGPVRGEVREPLARLREAFRRRGRVPRFEYVAELAPTLEGALRAAGFKQEAEARLMVCPRASYVAAPVPEGLTLTVLTPHSPRSELREYCATSRQGFFPEATEEVAEEEVERLRAELREGLAVLGRVGGRPVAVGLYSPPREGLSEVAGVATLEAYRGRGLGTALVARVAAEALERGVETLFLSTITEEAGRLYARVGFRTVSRMLFYVASRAESD